MAATEKRCKFLIDGRKWVVLGDPTIKLGGLKKTPVIDSEGKVIGYEEEGYAGMITANLQFLQGDLLSDITSKTDMTVECVFTNGKVYTGTNLNISNEPEVSGGQCSIELSGDIVTESAS